MNLQGPCWSTAVGPHTYAKTALVPLRESQQRFTESLEENARLFIYMNGRLFYLYKLQQITEELEFFGRFLLYIQWTLL
jgi:hypothetical protein